MPIERLTSGRYRVRIRKIINGSPIERAGTFDTRKEAESWEALTVSQLGASSMTIPEALDLYKTQHWEPQVDQKTTESGRTSLYKQIRRLESLKTRFRSYTLETFTPVEAKRYRDMRLKSVSGTTVRKELYFISGLYRWLIKEQMMSDLENPIAKVQLPSENASRETTHSDHDQAQLLANLKSPYRECYELLLQTACRVSEVVYMRIEWVNLSARYVQLPQDITKTKKPRKVPLTSRAAEIISQLAAGRSEGRLFDFKYDTFRRHYARTRDRLGLSHLRLHDCRHTALTRFAGKVSNVLDLQAISGHSTTNMLSRYVHQDVTDIANKLD